MERCGVDRYSDGFLAVVKKEGKLQPYIYYNDSKPEGRIRFTILHEIGHLILGHTQASLHAEAEANFFAKYAIAPVVFIEKKNPADFMELSYTFNVTPTCAGNIFSYYQKWLFHHNRVMKGTYTDYEQLLLNSFVDAAAS